MVLTRKKTQHFTCFFITALFQNVQNYKTILAHYFIMKIPNKRELQQIVSNHSVDFDFKDS